jgi:hypothetical protein
VRGAGQPTSGGDGDRATAPEDDDGWLASTVRLVNGESFDSLCRRLATANDLSAQSVGTRYD